MISGDILDNLRKNSQLYIKVGEGDYEPIGNCTNFELSCEAGSLPKINLELIQIPTPDNPIPVAEQTRIVDISDLVQYEPYEPVGKNLFNELKIDDSGITITCEGLRSSGKSLIEYIKHHDDSLDALRYCIDDITSTKKLCEEKEGKDMKLLNMYVEKSEKNIKDYYEKLLDEEYNNREVVKEFKDLCNKFQEDLAKLAEKTANEKIRLIDLEYEVFESGYGIECNPTEEEQEIREKLSEELRNLHDKIDEVNAQLEIITSDEYSTYHDINYVLRNYGIIDENNKLTPYTPTFVDEEAPAKEAPKKAGRPKKVRE